jgi:NADPH:quinone reductase-like Zn-dependent oxidoreductase
MDAENEHPNSGLPARALYYVAPRKVELRPVHVPFMAAGRQGETLIVRTLWSAISRGTERLVFEGKIPKSEFQRMRAPFQDGEFPFPVKYGYASVGVVEEGPAALLGKPVFTLYPHQSLYSLPQAAAVLLPEAVSPRRAILAANMETALNAMWDSEAGPGDRIVIVGAGAIGLLVATLAARLPGAEVTVYDINPGREVIAGALGAQFATPGAAGNVEADVVFHTSATDAGLALSLDVAGFEARIIELSWYGEKNVTAPLGSAFHSKRLRLISSQVGSVSRNRRARWSHARRIEKALALLADARLEALITDEVEFNTLPEKMAAVFAPSASGIVTAVRYPG